MTVDAGNFTGTGVLVGYTVAPTLQGSDRTLDSNVNPSGTTPAALPSCGSDLTVDFGYYKSVTIGDFVSRDARVLDARPEALFGQRVAVADAAGLDLDSHRSSAGLRDFAFHEFERSLRVWDLNSTHR